jgi:Tfp pilus assembly protein FimT
MHCLGLSLDDCRNTAVELEAKGVQFIPDRDAGEAVISDNSADWMVVVEPSNCSPEDFA